MMLSLLAIILVEGFVTIAVEILALRQLIPFVGNSVIVTSLIIGVFLLFLAIGYRRGGIYRDNYRAILKRNFTIAALIIGIGLSYSFIAYFFAIVGPVFGHRSLLVLSAYLLLIVAPAVYILGQTVPILTNLIQDQPTVGAISGRVLYVSTIGSFLGAVLTSLLLLNFLGVAWTVFINFLLLLVLALVLFDHWPTEVNRLLVFLVAGIITFLLNIGVEQQLFLHTNNFSNYQVRENYQLTKGNSGKVLIINDSLSSFLNKDGKAAPYIELIKTILYKDLNLQQKSILVLGAGGFTLSTPSAHENQFTYVDIDPDIRAVVSKHFNNKIHGTFIAADARAFLKTNKQHFSVIVSDAYNNRIAMPAYLLSQQHLQSIYNALSDEGYAIFNIIANPLLSDAYSKRVDNTIKSVFTNCMKIPTQYTDKMTNIIYLCHVNKNQHDNLVYTDNLNSAALDFFAVKR